MRAGTFIGLVLWFPIDGGIVLLVLFALSFLPIYGSGENLAAGGKLVCQRCTGSAFAVWPTFSHEKVDLTGRLSAYEHRSGESGRWIKLNFCPRCGTTVTSTFASFEKSSSAS